MCKEVPPQTLEAMLRHPMDASRNDALLFDADTLDESAVGWHQSLVRLERSEGRGKQPDLVFSWTSDEMLELGEEGLGKYPDWDVEEPFGLFLRTADLEESEALSLWEVLMKDDQPPWDLFEHVKEERFGLGWRCETTLVQGHECLGFATDVVCYGIVKHRLPGDLEAVWHQARLVKSMFPEQVDQIIARNAWGIRDLLRYHEGCVLRGSADLYMVW